MSLDLHAETASAPITHLRPDPLAAVESEPSMQIIRRNGKVTPFDSAKIAVAMTRAFLAVEGNSAVASRRVHEIVEQLTTDVVTALMRRAGEGRTFHIEDVQDQVELALMRSENHKVARAYVLYRAGAIVGRMRLAQPHSQPICGYNVVSRIRSWNEVFMEGV